MDEENACQEFESKNIDEKNYFIKETNENELMIKKKRKVLSASNFIEQLLILASAVTRNIKQSLELKKQ